MTTEAMTTPKPATDRVVLVALGLNWDGQNMLRSMDEEKWERLRASLPPKRLPPFEGRGPFFSMPEFVAELSEADAWIEAGIKPELSRVRGLSYSVHPRDLLRESLGMTAQVNHVHVTVHGNSLHTVTQVKVCEDYCTVALQDELDDGWRIIAVCPPNDRRRPDYVLGR